MTDEPIYQPIRWHFPPEEPQNGQSVTWIDLKGNQVDGTYHGSQLWVHVNQKRTSGANKVVAWRARTT